MSGYNGRRAVSSRARIRLGIVVAIDKQRRDQRGFMGDTVGPVAAHDGDLFGWDSFLGRRQV